MNRSRVLGDTMIRGQFRHSILDNLVHAVLFAPPATAHVKTNGKMD